MLGEWQEAGVASQEGDERKQQRLSLGRETAEVFI
jgi:hypothetical protein